MKALADLLEGAKSVEVVSTNPKDLAEFGLDQPKGELTIGAGIEEAADRHFLRQREPDAYRGLCPYRNVPKVFLLGANLQYYQTLMFQWVEGKQGKNA